ncbi:MAG: MotA/TolQ/ExbB proton channel family protein [Thermodesulfobacteriota bacterium]|nr:MotA/TolQ/ExbB proton channel family protein [Thermodesulfobacteriota bacterium]
MDIGALLKTFIYLIASSMLYPVLFLLVVITIWLFIYSGTFLAEFLERSRMKKTDSDKLCDEIIEGNGKDFFSKRGNRYLNALKNILKDNNYSQIKIENLLLETTQNIWKSTDRLRILVRVCPSLGLIGTLIPMGTGLAALGTGDLAQLSADLVIAFTTTVVGLAAGTAAFVFYTVKRRWLEQDVKNMELATEILVEETKKSEIS